MTRLGRCWAEIECDALPRERANRWLANRRSEMQVHSDTTLAELFALERGQAVQERRAFGFAAGAR